MHYSQLSLPSLRFLKTVAEIQVALQNRMTHLAERQTTLRNEVSEICSRWELPPEEVYAAGNDEQAVNAYTAKISNSLASDNSLVPARQLNRGLIERMTADTNRLAVLGRKHATRVAVLADLDRIARNLGDSGRQFDLSFTELATLGF